jgi:membrane associated rhomboid family serine protease
VPLLILGGLIWIAYGQGVLFVVMLLGSAGSGACTWLTSSGDLVIGASGMVYAFVGFLLGVAYYRPSIKSWLVATLSLALYSGAILALFEVTEGISWAGHFYGFVAGIFTAMLLFARQKKKTQKEN